jgi:hypothetical protein
MDTDDFGSKSGDDFPDLAVDMPEPPDDEHPQSPTLGVVGVDDEDEAQVEDAVHDEPRTKKAKISAEGVLENGMDKASSSKSKNIAVGGQPIPSQDMGAALPHSMMASPGSYPSTGYPPMMVMNPQMYTTMVAQSPYAAVPAPMPGADTSNNLDGASSRKEKGTKDGGTMPHQLPATMMNPAMMNPAMMNPAMMYNPYMMQQFQGMMNPFMYPRPGVGMFPPPLPVNVSKGISLYLSVDREMLSEYQLMVRQQLELFEAGAEDVESNTQGRKKQVVVGQVGLRCKHCAPFPLVSLIDGR